VELREDQLAQEQAPPHAHPPVWEGADSLDPLMLAKVENIARVLVLSHFGHTCGSERLA
jgi:hypothetical protein